MAGVPLGNRNMIHQLKGRVSEAAEPDALCSDEPTSVGGEEERGRPPKVPARTLNEAREVKNALTFQLMGRAANHSVSVRAVTGLNSVPPPKKKTQGMEGSCCYGDQLRSSSRVFLDTLHTRS